MNWVDWVIVGFLAISVITGFREGFIRLGIGFVALIAGFVAAAWMYGLAADPLLPLVHSRMLANFIGFNLIFFGVIVIGYLIASLIARIFHMVGLSIVDRTLGGIFGAVRGALIVVVVTMCLMAFAPRSLPIPFSSSRSAPYIIAGSRYLSALTPYELKQGFNRTFAQVQDIIEGLRKQKLTIREE